MTDRTPANSSSSEDAPVIEGYRVLERLGRGATSSIWKAEQISLNRPVVIKVLMERLAQTPEDVGLFKAEAMVTANLKHPNIVQVYDFGQSKKRQCYYFVMEYISGYSVGEWLRRSGKLAESDALIIAQSVAEALQYAWDLSRIVHRDIKPDNIMVDGDGSVKIADLGVAHAVKTIGRSAGSDEPVVAGTPNYMAPEQIRDVANIDCRTDIYALGASLYHIVTGQLPFGESPVEIVLQRQLQETFEYPQIVNPDLSTGLTRLIVKMTAKDPAARFQTWNEVLAEVIRLERLQRQFQHGRTASAPAKAAPHPPAAARPPAEPKKTSAAATAGATCRHCGKPAQAQARYCAFCGKSLAAAAPEPAEDRRRLTIRLKPIRTARPPGAQPAAAPPAPRHSRRSRISYSGSIRMVVSLGLLAFLAYAGFVKVKYDRNVFIPLKAAIRQTGQALLGRGRALIKPETTLPPAESPQPVPEETPAEMPVAQSEVAPEPEPSAAAASINEPAAGEQPVPAAEPAATETAATETPDAQTQPPPAPGEPETPEPAAAVTPAAAEERTAPAKPPATMDYERILAKCKRQQPKAGERIALRFKDGRTPVEGLLEQQTAGGVVIKVAAGVIEYPFRLMTEETRLLYFPEERAHRFQQQQLEKSK
ncbi:MAG: protein kinase [Lentisphaerae bacterium]|nr:protein kinase [Lentisphaerota bacterium]